jgi:8-oxo-dGTP diphosphatase
MKEISVVAAIIKYNNKILCVQRGENKYEYISYKYEFPGGKIEKGESLKETVIREINEELKMLIKPEEAFITVTHQYPDFLLTMHTFICSCEDPKIILTEHIDYKWLATNQLENLDWAAADIPIVNKLVSNG